MRPLDSRQPRLNFGERGSPVHPHLRRPHHIRRELGIHTLDGVDHPAQLRALPMEQSREHIGSSLTQRHFETARGFPPGHGQDIGHRTGPASRILFGLGKSGSAPCTRSTRQMDPYLPTPSPHLPNRIHTCASSGDRNSPSEWSYTRWRAAHHQDPVAYRGRFTGAGHPVAVRVAAGDLRTVPALAARRGLGVHPEDAAGLRRCRWPHRLARERGFHDRARSSARRPPPR